VSGQLGCHREATWPAVLVCKPVWLGVQLMRCAHEVSACTNFNWYSTVVGAASCKALPERCSCVKRSGQLLSWVAFSTGDCNDYALPHSIAAPAAAPAKVVTAPTPSPTSEGQLVRSVLQRERHHICLDDLCVHVAPASWPLTRIFVGTTRQRC
jgi:hypothetical protein